MDISAAALAAQRAALAEARLSADLIEADLLSWAPNQPMDGVYEQTCLCALPPERWPSYARRLHAWIRPGGVLFALFMQTGQPGGPPFHCDLSAMAELFPARDWHWLDDQPQHAAHGDAREELGYRLERR